MAGAAGANDHNSRYCHLTFVCRTRGVTHGLAGYFESTLYESQIPQNKGAKVEISTHPERIDQKSKDMISWFPIFFPLKVSLHRLWGPVYVLTLDRNLSTSPPTQSSRSACGDRPMIPEYGTSGSSRLGHGLGHLHASRLVPRICAAVGRLLASCR